MKQGEAAEAIRESCAALAEAERPDSIQNAANGLHNILSGLFEGGLGHSPLGENGLLNSTSALSCVFREPLRTQLYQGAVLDAVRTCLERKDVCRVLYIGTGPAASLLLHTMSQVNPEEVSVTFLEGHKNSFRLLNYLIYAGGFHDFVDETFLVDARNSGITDRIGSNFDVVVTETMAQALLYEPQAAITLNLGEEVLSEGGVWLPQRVRISLETTLDGNKLEMPFFDLEPSGVSGRSADFTFDPQEQRVTGVFDFEGSWAERRPFKINTAIQIDEGRTLPSESSAITRSWLLEYGQSPILRKVRVSYQLGGFSHEATVHRV